MYSRIKSSDLQYRKWLLTVIIYHPTHASLNYLVLFVILFYISSCKIFPKFFCGGKIGLTDFPEKRAPSKAKIFITSVQIFNKIPRSKRPENLR